MPQGAKLEIESVLRETCDRVLSNPQVPATKRQLRAVALQILGDAYAKVLKDTESEEAEYVRIDTKSSRERDAQRTG